MKNIKTIYKRLIYFGAFLLLTAIEVYIALYVQNVLIRAYVGDVIVIWVIVCFVKVFIPDSIRLLPLYVYVFAVMIEIAQYFDIVYLIGLGDIEFFRILIGTAFAWLDIVCYGAGAIVCFGIEALLRILKSNKS